MITLSAFIFLLFSTCAFCEGGLSLTACSPDDVECFKTMADQFFEETYRGIPEYNIEPFDPLSIPSLNISIDDEDKTEVRYRNLIVRGLKDQKLSYLKFDSNDNVLTLITRENPEVDGEATVEFIKASKSYDGTVTFKGRTLIKATCNYNIITDENGVKHIVISTASSKCTPLGRLDVTLSPGLHEAVKHDKGLYKRNIRKLYCKIVEKAYETVLNDIRQADKVMPESEILKGT